MAYHEALWVVEGTVAPVLGLANAVAMGQAMRAASAIARRPRRRRDLGFRRFFKMMFTTSVGVLYQISGVCFIIEILVLYNALTSISNGNDRGSTTASIWYLVVAFALLPIQVLAGSFVETPRGES